MELSVRQVTSGGGDKQSEFLSGFPCDEEQKRDRNKLQINRKPKRHRRFFRRLFGCCGIQKSNRSKQRKKIEEYGRENSFGENFLEVPTEGELILNESNSKSEESKENCNLVKIPTHININVDADFHERNSAEVPQKVVYEGLETIPKLEHMESVKVIENNEALSKEILPFDHQKEITEAEKNWLQTELKQLPIPFFWLSEYYKSEKASACARERNCDTTDGWLKGKTLRQDHFQTVAYHLWLSARYCLDMLDYNIALKELAQGKFALQHFSEAMQKIDGKGDSSLEAKRGDQDVEKSLNLMINGSLAFISYQMTNYRDAEQLLQAMSKIDNQVSAVKGIQATILAYSETAIEVAVKLAQEAAMMDPTYWRWHALTSLLMQHLPKPDNVSEKINRREMILAEMETAFHLEKNNAKSAFLLGDAYRNAVFQVRGQKGTNENYEEYAKQAVNAYVAAIERAPNCSIMHTLAARSLWSLRKQCSEASRRALWAADKATVLLVRGDIDEECEEDEEMEGKAEAAMLLGVFWDCIGNIDKSLMLLRMAASNPKVRPHVAYRAEFGIIVASFKKEKSQKIYDEGSKINVMDLLDKLMGKFPNSYIQQQILCYKGQYLMDVKKDNDSAINMFFRAISINPHSIFLKRFYPSFGSIYRQPFKISEMVFDLACKELTVVLVQAKNGSSEAIKRRDFLNECIKRVKDMEDSENPITASNNKKNNFKSETHTPSSENSESKQVFKNEDKIKPLDMLFFSEDDLKTNDNSDKGVKVISGEQMESMDDKDEVNKVSLIKMMRENEKEHLKGTEQLVDLAADPDLKVNEDCKNTNILINSEQIPNILETNDGLNDKEECDIGHRNESDNDILVQVGVNNIGRGKPDGIEGNDPLDKPLLGSENVMESEV